MTPERWRQVEEIFQTALDLAPGERAPYLAEACGADAELRRDVEAMLAQYEEAGDFLDEPLVEQSGLQELAALMGEADKADPLIGQRVGAYRIEREIGRGGMGVVYLAQRADGAFRMRAAVKVIKRGMDTDFVLRRFRHERRILASLQHYNIARLFDAGATESGLPYFVMEYIEGEPLYDYCDARSLPLRERLRLFAEVCDAVHYAHQKQVVHRDIKPSNILVNPAGVPKLFDFGIAKLLNPELTPDTAPQTLTAMRMMTVEYASPEQVQGLPVTSLSDVYSLGVLLYELLTGRRPYRFRSRLPHDVALAIAEQEPERPSLAVTRTDNLTPAHHASQQPLTAELLAELRGAAPDELRLLLAGALDNVALKALRKVPAERYDTAAALREDINNYLEGRPVNAPAYLPPAPAFFAPARPPAAPPAALPRGASPKSVAVLPLKLLDTGTGGTDTDDSYLGVGLADALITRLSNVRSLTLRPTSAVLRHADETTDPAVAGRELDVDFVLDGRIRRAGERIRISLQLLDVRGGANVWAESFDERFADVLELEDSISGKVADSLVPQLTGDERRGLEKRGTDSAQAHHAYLRGRYFWNQFTPDTFPRVLEAFEHAVALDPDYALAHAGVASYYNWASIFGLIPSDEGYEKTKAAARRALELDDSLSDAYAVLGFITAFPEWDWEGAERLLRKSLELNPNNGLAHEWLAAVLAGVGRDEEGTREIIRAQEIDPLSPRAMVLTAWTLYQLHHYQQSLARANEIIDLNPQFWQGYVQRGNVLLELGREPEALADLQRGYQLMPDSGITSYKLAYALVAANRREEAREVTRKLEALAAERYVNHYHLAMCHAALGERDEAFAEFDKALGRGDLWLVWLATEPKLDGLRDDERFNDLLRRSNRPHLARARAPKKERAADGPQAIGVLPFKIHAAATTGENTEDRFLEVGLTDALITRLSKIRSFVLRPASSVLGLQDAGPFDAGRALGVAYVLDGHIRRVGERVRVTVQLLDIEGHTTRWAEQFDERFTDVLELEDSISEKVATSLVPRLTTDERRRLGERGTRNPQAHEAYLRGRYFWGQFTNESLPKALASFQKAVALDPGYALAHAELANFYNWASILGAVPALECYEAGKRAARRALELDPRLSEAHAAAGCVASVQEWDWAEAERLYRRALELNPHNSLAHEWLSTVLLGTGRVEEGVAEMRRSEELDPLSLRQMTMMAWTLYQARRYDEATAKAREMVEMDPRYWQGPYQLANAYLHTGREEEAVALAREALSLAPDSGAALYLLCFALVATDRREEARAILDRLKEAAAVSYVKPYFIAMAHAALDERDAALEWFERARLDRGGWLMWLTTEPKLDRLREDPRFADLLRRVNLRPAERGKRPAPDTAGGEKTIAVLPLKILGAATGDTDDYLGVGLADTLITRLSNVRRFVVRPTASVLRFADQQDPFAAGRELAARYVLDGYIRRAGGRLRVTLQLLDVENEAAVWAEQFGSDDGDVLALEDSIAERVARALVPQLSGEEQRQISKRGTDDPEAYELYLRGRFHWSLMTEEGFAKAIGYYERAVELDPSYALAYTAIVEYFIFLGVQCVLPFAECARRATAAAERAAALDPSLAEAQAALGVVAINQEFDWAKAERYASRAAEMNPNSFMANQWLKTLYLQTGRFDEALKQARRLLDIAPDSMMSLHFLAWTHHCSRRLDESISVHRQLVKDAPHYAFGRLSFSWTLRCAGEFEEAVAQARKGVELAPDNPLYLSGLAAAEAGAGRLAEARRALGEIVEMSAARYVSPYMLAIVYLALGERSRALDQLERAFAIRDVWVVWVGVEPQFDPLRTDARFADLLRRMNHPLAPGRK